MTVRSTRFIYSLTAHDVEDLLERLGQRGLTTDGAPIFYCDAEGRCILDDPEAIYLQTMADMLNEAAGEGRRLKQLIFRQRRMIAIWEEERETTAGE